MTPDQFDKLAVWIRKEAKAAVGARTYKNDRAIEEVREEAERAKSEARRVLIDYRP